MIMPNYEIQSFGIQNAVLTLCDYLSQFLRVKILTTSSSRIGLREMRGYSLVASHRLRGLDDPVAPMMCFQLLADKCHLAFVHGLPFTMSILAAFVYWLKRTPTVLFVHGRGYPSKSILARMRDSMLGPMMRTLVDLVLTMNESDSQHILRRYRLRPEKIKILKIGIPCEQNTASVSYRTLARMQENQLFEVLCVGRLVPEKGVDRLIRAFSVFKKQHTDSRLTIVGDGRERTRLEMLVRTLGLHADVKFEGFRADVAPYYVKSHVLVVPSITTEGLPRVILEAFAVGTPVVASDTPDLREHIHEGINGMLFKNEEELIRCLSLIKGSNSLHSRLAIGAMRSAKALDMRQTCQTLLFEVSVLLDRKYGFPHSLSRLMQ
jgi:glycosyltransferase involved in cell wall biosynthesis